MGKVKLNLVVAMCNNRGIGINGQLPWRLKGDMAFFKKITSETNIPDRQNVVIMGRKTWQSIPQKFRPLPNRINIVISSTLPSTEGDVHVARGFDEALEAVQSMENKVDQVFIIGGSSLYQLALSSDHPVRLYLTTVLADFECDTFLPKVDDKDYKLISDPSVDSSIVTDQASGTQYKIEVYDKRVVPPLYCMCAMSVNRGIGLDGHLPWPSIPEDYRYYSEKTSAVSCPDKKVVRIKGRLTWDETGPEERSCPSAINIVISNTLSGCPPQVDYVATSLSHAVDIAADLHAQVECMFVMGGQNVYKEAMLHPLCERIYLTRILSHYDADRLLPPFEHRYQLIGDPSVNSEVQQHNGVRFQFEVYQRREQ